MWFSTKGIIAAYVQRMWTGVLIGTLGAISTEIWSASWIILELNLISFLIMITGRWPAKKTGIIYFIVQRIGTLIILRGGVIAEWSSPLTHWVILGLLLKTRMAPFHFWGANLITKLSGKTSFVFLTWQKIAPLFIMMVTTSKYFIRWVLILNILVATRCRIGSKNLFVLLFFSGLIHVCWIISSPITVARVYFFIYSCSSMPIFLITHNLSLLIMNLAGLPPLTGFFMKLKVLQIARLRWGFVLLLASAPLLYAYIRSFLINSSSQRDKIKITTISVCSMGLIL